MSTEIDKETRTLRWAHPTGKVPRHVVMVGLGPTKTHLLDVTSAHSPDASLMEADEWWGVNGGANHYGGRMHYDMIWMMDYMDGEAHAKPKYLGYVEKYIKRYNIPLITSQAGKYRDLPQVHEYPLHWVYKRLDCAEPYFHNSIPYMLAYAIAIGVEEITLWGIDYSWRGTAVREDDKANAEYWVGFARAKGVKVNIPSTSTLLSVNKGWHLYGYREIPRAEVFKNLKDSDVKAELTNPPSCESNAVPIRPAASSK